MSHHQDQSRPSALSAATAATGTERAPAPAAGSRCDGRPDGAWHRYGHSYPARSRVRGRLFWELAALIWLRRILAGILIIMAIVLIAAATLTSLAVCVGWQLHYDGMP